MVTVKEPPPTEPNEAQIIAEKAQAAIRIAVAGSPVGAVRRISLYILVAVAVLSAPHLAAAIGIAALVLLVATDDLR